jgi:Reverse transcriptase (RNA-dependent DNA polymerase)/Endonuclease-reverse transcriptase
MSEHPSIHIVSVNMRKRNAVTHALLNSITNTHLILLQEPWFSQIGTARQDNAREGVDVLGGVAAPAWDIIYPNCGKDKPPKVMAYVRKQVQSIQDAAHFTVVPRLDICSHPTVQVLDIILDTEQWRVINFYHDVRDDSSLDALLDLDIDAVTPTLVIGDFNAHSQAWSPLEVPRSGKATRIEEWAARNLLTLANTPGEVTRRGAKHEKDSVIDLAWYNEAATMASTFSGLSIDWEGSLGSDHAMLHVSGCTRELPPQHSQETDLGYVVDPEKGEEWTRSFKTRSRAYQFQLTPTEAEVEEEAAAFTADIHRTNMEIFRKRRPYHPKASPWWNAACALAAQNLRNARSVETRGIAQARLKGTVRAAKRKWADEYIEKAQLWDVAAWRHGRKLSKVPSLRGPEGLVHTHSEVAGILSQRFFSQTPPEVEANFADDPPPRPTRTMPPLERDLIASLLNKAATRSAPGQTGHTWTILKWVWKADPERLERLLAACLKAGHHPRPWKEAIVCVIPKPNRADYTLAKNFRPISLLECLGKLLEKIVAKIIYNDMTKYALVPTTQFGGRNASSTLDAGLTLLHDIEAAHRSKLRAGLLLFDIQGYFDHINHERLIQVFTNLGFAPELIKWCRSFLKDRTVKLKFNGKTSDPFNFSVGTPQGSPVSPVLSTIYTSPLLHKMKEWTNASLGMYVDDGVIFACGDSWETIENTMRTGYTTCSEWLVRAGLNAEPDKTELIFFRRRKERVDPPQSLQLPLITQNATYKVTAANTLRYLGFFFDTRLTWSHHVNVMCNRARATLKALQLLGNSVRGLDQARWRLAYNAICLPVLTYGCQLWFKGKQVTLVKKLQTVQNDAVKLISGTFRTTPRDPLHQLLNILPMKLRLTMVVQNSALRLYRAPKESQLLKRLGGTWRHPATDDLPLPAPIRDNVRTTLRDLATRVPAGGPRITAFPDIPPGAPTWNGRVHVIPKQKDWDYEVITKALTAACQGDSLINISCNGVRSNRGRDDGKQIGATSAVLYQGGRERRHTERILGETVTEPDTLLRALHAGFDALTYFLDNQSMRQANFITISLPSGSAINKALDTSPHEDQEESIAILRRLSVILEKYPDTNIVLIWLPRKAPFIGFKRAKQLALEAIRTANLAGIREPHTINNQREATKSAAIAAWTEEWHQSPHTSKAYRTALTMPPDGKPHHTFYCTHPNKTDAEPQAKFSRLTHSTFYRLITGHAFTGEYTQRFFPQHTPEQVACQCGEPIQTVEHVLLQCPLFNAARRKHLTVNGRPRSFPQLLENSERTRSLLQFLEETRACNKPRAEWEPG